MLEENVDWLALICLIFSAFYECDVALTEWKKHAKNHCKIILLVTERLLYYYQHENYSFSFSKNCKLSFSGENNNITYLLSLFYRTYILYHSLLPVPVRI